MGVAAELVLEADLARDRVVGGVRAGVGRDIAAEQGVARHERSVAVALHRDPLTLHAQAADQLQVVYQFVLGLAEGRDVRLLQVRIGAQRLPSGWRAERPHLSGGPDGAIGAAADERAVQLDIGVVGADHIGEALA